MANTTTLLVSLMICLSLIGCQRSSELDSETKTTKKRQNGNSSKPNEGDRQSVCEDEVQSVCGEDSEDVEACVQQNASQFSDECQSEMSEIQSLIQSAQSACESDRAKYCSSQQFPQAFQCLQSKGGRLSSACRSALSELPPPPGGGR